MKKYILIVFAFLLIGSTGCDDNINDLFANPNIYGPSEQLVPRMFAQMMNDVYTSGINGLKQMYSS